MKIGLRLSILSILFVISCSDTVHLSIDNPTEFSIAITIDTLSVIVPPSAFIMLEVNSGEHQLILDNNSIINYNFIQPAYMINPSLSAYLISEEYYGSEESSRHFKSTISKKEVSFLGMSLTGNYDVVNEVINEVTWQYGPREPLPKSVDIDDKKSYTSRIKIYDASEFMALLKSENIK